MPKCNRCGKDTDDSNTTTCFNDHIEYPDNEALSRLPHSEDGRCPVCNVIPGAIHHKDCYMERCPRCENRLISCGCLTER